MNSIWRNPELLLNWSPKIGFALISSRSRKPCSPRTLYPSSKVFVLRGIFRFGSSEKSQSFYFLTITLLSFNIIFFILGTSWFHFIESVLFSPVPNYSWVSSLASQQKITMVPNSRAENRLSVYPISLQFIPHWQQKTRQASSLICALVVILPISPNLLHHLSRYWNVVGPPYMLLRTVFSFPVLFHGFTSSSLVLETHYQDYNTVLFGG